jgi:DNA-binding Xre family transcriptional regulator
MKIKKSILELALAEKGFTFADLAAASGVSRATLSYINNGKSCRADIALKIARALGKNVSELIEKELPRQ